MNASDTGQSERREAIEIEPIGSVLALDDLGYFVNPCASRLIVGPWRNVVDDTVGIYRSRLDTVLKAVCVRGSVARGIALEGIGDVDTFAVISGSRWQVDTTWIREAQTMLDQRYPWQTGVEMQVVTENEIADANNRNTIGFFIKCLSTSVWGRDYRQDIPPFKPGDFLVTGIGEFEQRISKFHKVVGAKKLAPETVSRLCQWTMKSLVRTGFLLVAERERTYTRDLYPSFATFSRYYPEHKTQMEQALNWSLNPTQNLDELSIFIEEFGGWLIETVKQRYPD